MPSTLIRSGIDCTYLDIPPLKKATIKSMVNSDTIVEFCIFILLGYKGVISNAGETNKLRAHFFFIDKFVKT